MNLGFLRQRAVLLERLRGFFLSRGFLEVETPLVAAETIPEAHIDLSETDGGWLQASPEMHHKRLLCSGSGPIFEVTRSFRRGETGRQHRPEFTIVEWYRPGDDMAIGIDLLDDLLRELIDAPPARRTTYREAFRRTLGLDPHAASEAELDDALGRLPGMVEPEGSAPERDDLLSALLSVAVEPTLGQDAPEILYHYPATQAALAATARDDRGVEVAERFELYWRGLELANGYHELTDPVELRSRLSRVNELRDSAGSRRLPMPEQLLADMHGAGLPACAGVALGFDRLVMLATGADSIAAVRAFSDGA